MRACELLWQQRENHPQQNPRGKVRRASALRAVALAALVLGASPVAGCRHPVVVKTDARVQTETFPTITQQPLVPMAVDGRAYQCNGHSVAIIDVDGVLLNMDMTGLYSVGENPVALLREKLDQVKRDPCVRAVVLRINSPGGGVTASDIMRHEVEQFRAAAGLPVVACLMDVGAGGGYYLATAADHIVAHPTTITGGIGVILNLYNMQDALAQFNILAMPIRSGRHIDMGSPVREPLLEERAILQAMADEFGGRFRHVVETTRPLPAAGREAIFDGRVFSAAQALSIGLIDQIGYLDDAVATARALGGIPPGTGSVVVFHRCRDRARTPYAITPNVPLNNTLIPFSLPGFDRSRLPTFLYLWQPDPTLEKAGGR